MKVGDRVSNLFGELGSVIEDKDGDGYYLVMHDVSRDNFRGIDKNECYYLEDFLTPIIDSNKLFEEWMA